MEIRATALLDLIATEYRAIQESKRKQAAITANYNHYAERMSAAEIRSIWRDEQEARRTIDKLMALVEQSTPDKATA